MRNTESDKEYTVSEMLHMLKNRRSGGADKRSISEIDTVIDEIMERNPELVQQLNQLNQIERKYNER
jgi:hypothetical protein